jgi:hypothetical protein
MAPRPVAMATVAMKRDKFCNVLFPKDSLLFNTFRRDKSGKSNGIFKSAAFYVMVLEYWVGSIGDR